MATTDRCKAPTLTIIASTPRGGDHLAERHS
jgi:hypothetical protein